MVGRSLRATRAGAVTRVAALDCRVSYGPTGERAVLPQQDDIEAAARVLLASAPTRRSKKS